MAEREFLEVVESLPKIKELYVGIFTKDGLNKLLNSYKLQSSMCALSLIDPANIEMSSLLGCISKMKCLQQLSMRRLLIVEESCIYDTYCLNMLQSVAIMDCSFTHVTWLKHAPLLQELIIHGGISMEEVIKEDETTKNYENVDSSSNSTLSSSLVDLNLFHLPNLQSIYKTALSFPSLKCIKISNCPNLKKLPLHSSSAKHMILIKGEQEWWNSLKWDDLTAKYHLQSKFKPMPESDLAYQFEAFLVAERVTRWW